MSPLSSLWLCQGVRYRFRSIILSRSVAGAVLCLSFTRLPYFQSLGVPAAIGVFVALVAAYSTARIGPYSS